MRLTLTDEQRLLEASALDFLGAEYDFQQRAASVDHPDGCRPEVWSRFAQLGWLGLPVCASHGGVGGGVFDTGLLMRALGRHLVVEPYHGAIVMAAALLGSLAGARNDGILGRVIAGELRAALAHDEVGRGLSEPRLCTAMPCPGGWRLNGRKMQVIGAPGADLLIVTARGAEGGTAVFLVDGDRLGLESHAYRLIDGRRASDLTLRDLRLPAEARLGAGDSTRVLHQVMAHGLVALCWEAVGAMSAAFEQTVAHTRQRVQFGKPLAKFQVVEHKLAEMALACEESLAACELASLRIDAHADSALAAAMAKSRVGRAARLVAKEAVQLHGGMGVSEELAVASLFRKLVAFGAQGASTASCSAMYGQASLADASWRASQTLMEPVPESHESAA